MAKVLSSSQPAPTPFPHFIGKSARALVTEDANSVNVVPSPTLYHHQPLLCSPAPPLPTPTPAPEPGTAVSTFPGAVRSGLLGDRDNAGERLAQLRLGPTAGPERGGS